MISTSEIQAHFIKNKQLLVMKTKNKIILVPQKKILDFLQVFNIKIYSYCNFRCQLI